jgi:hypothetical protein
MLDDIKGVVALFYVVQRLWLEPLPIVADSFFVGSKETVAEFHE